MKMILAIIQNADRDNLTSALRKAKFGHTRLNTTGGFLRQGNTTLVIGVEDAEVETVLRLIESTCHEREVLHRPGSGALHADAYVEPVKILVGGATVFVLTMDQFRKL
ncbi:MAG: hypothetical protein C7B46_11125 [Sulfobacillus benefaciens]|uniref:Transcriptional regulator n=1 Tax=Sulfobacillus benefaciens TaxID=453960 RepID=A0A2T2XF66_9FIRM|nr:MAG: hypothetical protein C7B46_11125 [Sulfobacillus benefaciens]